MAKTTGNTAAVSLVNTNRTQTAAAAANRPFKYSSSAIAVNNAAGMSNCAIMPCV